MLSKSLIAAALATTAASLPHMEERQAAEGAQCGGAAFTGPKTCSSGSTCVYENQSYSQCRPSKPCDIYAQGGTPCAAAHSTTRALYAGFNGALYQVQKASGQYLDIPTVGFGGIANSSAQDSFCAGTTCVITQIYDQSPNGNHLGEATGHWKGPGPNGYDKFASATGAPVYLGGKKVYGVYISPGYGYRRSNCTGTVTGNGAEGVYDVIDGTHYNQWCCFDYGNSEVSGTDTGNGHMSAIYFGDSTQWDSGAGAGPWIMADLENGMYSGYDPKNNPEQPIDHRFVTAMLRGASTDHFDIRGGDATAGDLTYYVNSSYPAGYYPMHREGAIILGTGGDNSNSGQGTFYEGAMTVGYPSDATQNAVQANIVSAAYSTGSASKLKARAFTTDSTVSLVAAAADATRRGIEARRDVEARYITHTGAAVHTELLSSTTSDESRLRAASWIVRPGLGNAACYSFESVDEPGRFLRSERSQGLTLSYRGGGRQFDEDATFCIHDGLGGNGHTIQSWNEPNHYIRYHQDGVWLSRNGGDREHDAVESFSEDASWVVLSGFF